MAKTLKPATGKLVVKDSDTTVKVLPGDGPSVGAPLVADPEIAGVCFTGSTDVAKAIERQ